MLKRIWQRMVKWFRRWFGFGRKQKPTLPTIHQQPPSSLTDTDYEFLLLQLLEGVAYGWQQARILRFFEVLSERGKQELWVAWLRHFGERLLASPVPNNELAARMVQLGELGCGEIGEVAYEIGMQLLIRPTQTQWANTSVDGREQRENDSQVEAVISQFNASGQSAPDEAVAWYNQGVQQYNAGDLLATVTSWERATQIKPNFHNAWFNKGIALSDLGRYKEALASYDKAIEFQPDFHNARYNRGIALSNLGRYQEALASYDKAIEFQPDFHGAWNNRGNALSNLGRLKEAIASYDRAIDIKPDLHEAWLNRGGALEDLGQLKEALASFDKAIEIKPNKHEAWCVRANALYKLGRWEKALASYDKAIEFQPDFHEALNNRGLVLKDLGHWEEAIASYNNVLKTKPDDHEAWSNRGVALKELGRLEEACTNYDKAIEFKPDFYQAWNNLGDALNNLYRYEEAINNFDRALQIKPDNWESWIGRGIAAVSSAHPNRRLTSFVAQNNPALKQRSYDGQLASYEEGLKYVYPDTHPEGWGRLHQAIGNAYYFRGHRDLKPFSYWHQAVAEYNEALKTFTEEAFPEACLEVFQDLLKAQLGLGKTDKAKELGRRGRDLLQRLLDGSKSPARKKQLAFKFAGFNQLTVDLAVQSGNWCAALEIAEQGKNGCLSWLLYAGSDEIASPKWSQLKRLLNPTTAMIYWHLSPAALTTFILKHNAPSPIVIATPTLRNKEGLLAQIQRLREFEDWVKDWDQKYTDYRSQAKDEQSRSNHSWRAGMKQRLENLKNILNIPAIEQELKDIIQLILIPHRDLHRFPIHALFTNNFDFTITYLPSAQIGINLQSRRPNTTNHMLSVEAPTSKETTSLEFAQIESEVISQIFDKPKRIQLEHATKKQVEDALSNEYSVFHFTGHGTHNFSNPKKSELALADEEKLTLEEICQKDLTSYNLVSLSACETAITGNQTITTEYVGLVSGFMSRGVAQVVSTLWTVDSAATALVMIEFYRRRRTATSEATTLIKVTQWLRELTVGQLREWYEAFLTQLPPDKERIRFFLETELYKISKMEPNKKLYDHPYYWAAFTVTGKR